MLTTAGHETTRLGECKAIADGAALAVNSPAQAVSATSLSLASSGLVIIGQTYAFPTPTPLALSRPDRVFTTAGQIVTLLGSSAAIVDGTVFSVGGSAKTVSGTILSLASAGLIVDGQQYRFPTPMPATMFNAVLIDGTTLSAGGPATTLSGTTLTLVSGTAGLYLSGLGTSPSAFSTPVTAGESMAMDSTGQLIEGGSDRGTEGGFEDGDLGFLVMLGFRSPGAASPSDGKDTTVRNGTGDATSVTDFEGHGIKTADIPTLTAFVLAMYVLVLTFC